MCFHLSIYRSRTAESYGNTVLDILRVVNGKFIPVTAFMPPRLAEINVFSTEMEQKDLELLIFQRSRREAMGRSWSLR